MPDARESFNHPQMSIWEPQKVDTHQFNIIYYNKVSPTWLGG